MAFTPKPGSSKTIIECLHCHDRFTSLTGSFCSKCKTPEKRAALDAANKITWEESKSVTPFHCEFCEHEARREANRNK